ncbi:cyclopropane fatty acyl phospholipid synthase [Dickeya fangzhongdai]|uniref:cyclopropane fatty acyl phospholipid synthase n=1 Tax=Dickeya fangzhongdai TaxID=1778540 RepID=UPI0004F5D3A5|nr:cyclopropane fatty acyl phospholipid synthase [Dickeya fangzhongdai]AIR71702.1 cyclopropane fatty acyl phospholipid synthase [Dickeya fangzhongdai]KGT97402.1 cyclopropane fatty acyl phospholipid synthase [Dickeya fangzhongdai]KHN52864.1 cyclopropane fatty acyl phospholipid synthase [Dickeya fangzhongdai]WPD75708.1 cyclopropane fatty acyl phospholipid synthase [Dickeya fangzhongdai]
MSSSYTEELGSANTPWFQIVKEMLSAADIVINGSRPFDIQVKNPDMYKRVLREGSLGLGESYMDGWWECERLDMFFHRVLRAGLENQLPHRWRDTLRILMARLTNRQSRRRAKIVAKEHYDLGNDLFALMLDPYMQYTCGYWKQAETLEQAQQDKLRLICEKLQLRRGMTLLDLGCGWGGLAEFAARHYGVSVTGITISREQQALAQQRCQGLDVTILLRDYRDMDQQFDRITAVGILEHVGPNNYDTFFQIVRKNLKSNSLFLLHTIGGNTAKLNVDDWIDKYIFPNGCVPSIQYIAKASEPYLVMEDWHNFGSDYDHTLMAWHDRFQQNWSSLSERYSDRFQRMFSYYLNACAGAFRARNIQLWQVLFSVGGVEGGLRVPR